MTFHERSERRAPFHPYGYHHHVSGPTGRLHLAEGVLSAAAGDRSGSRFAPGRAGAAAQPGTAIFRADNEIEWAQIALLFAPCGLG